MDILTYVFGSALLLLLMWIVFWIIKVNRLRICQCLQAKLSTVSEERGPPTVVFIEVPAAEEQLSDIYEVPIVLPGQSSSPHSTVTESHESQTPLETVYSEPYEHHTYVNAKNESLKSKLSKFSTSTSHQEDSSTEVPASESAFQFQEAPSVLTPQPSFCLAKAKESNDFHSQATAVYSEPYEHHIYGNVKLQGSSNMVPQRKKIDSAYVEPNPIYVWKVEAFKAELKRKTEEKEQKSLK